MADHSPAISDKAFEKFLNASVSSESGDLEEALENIKSKFANNPAVAGGIAARLEGRDVDSSRDSDLLNSTDFAVNSNRSSAEVSTGAPATTQGSSGFPFSALGLGVRGGGEAALLQEGHTYQALQSRPGGRHRVADALDLYAGGRRAVSPEVHRLAGSWRPKLKLNQHATPAC
ncbi:hypothetical protein CYMTET_12636 [Cymbomonas tetramitiformis]|uniref:Uncharacterized protein n=1 Tax=Cymbomonas tetramitiformis TaxID=36881 RepID=A0AAE0LC87_9CHLO|nr:hypothetical protein CYMTET_12636 [Cymbomonas tetramitiformis]